MIMLQPQAAKPEAEVTWIVYFLLARSPSQPELEVACVSRRAATLALRSLFRLLAKKINGLKISVAGNWQCGTVTGGRNLNGAEPPVLLWPGEVPAELQL